MGGRMVHSSSIVARTSTRKADTQPGQIYELTDMDVEEVSLVDRAANKRQFLVIKRSDQMATEVQPDGKGGFTSRAGAGKKTATQTQKAAMEVPPGFKEMVSPLLTKAVEMLTQLSDDLAGAKPAEVGEDGSVPGVPADFASGLQSIMGMLDKACNMYPAAPAEAPEGEEPPAEGGEATEPDEMQMRLALDNVGKVFGGKVAKAAVLKIGAKMSKDRFTRLQQAAQVLSNLIAELGPATTAPAATTPAGKTAKNDGAQPASDPALKALEGQLTQLVEQVGKLAGVVKSTATDLAAIKKSRGAPSAAPVETGGEQRSHDQDFSWPMDMNNPVTRDTVGKSESFFDE